MADPRNVTMGKPFVTVNADGSADAHFSWTPASPLPQVVIQATVHFTLPQPDQTQTSTEQQKAIGNAIKLLGAAYIRDHERGLIPVPTVPAFLAAYDGQSTTLDLDDPTGA